MNRCRGCAAAFLRRINLDRDVNRRPHGGGRATYAIGDSSTEPRHERIGTQGRAHAALLVSAAGITWKFPRIAESVWICKASSSCALAKEPNVVAPPQAELSRVLAITNPGVSAVTVSANGT